MRQVVAPGRGHDRDVHPVDLLDLVVVDLGEDHLLLDAERVVARGRRSSGSAGRGSRACAAPRRDEPVEELVHPRAAQRHRAADRHAPRSPKFAIDFLAWVTTGFWPVICRQLLDRRVELLRVLARVAHADVQHDLREPRHLVGFVSAELLRQPRPHRRLVVRLQPGLADRRPSAPGPAASVATFSPRPLAFAALCLALVAALRGLRPSVLGHGLPAPRNRLARLHARSARPCRRRPAAGGPASARRVLGSISITFE